MLGPLLLSVVATTPDALTEHASQGSAAGLGPRPLDALHTHDVRSEAPKPVVAAEVRRIVSAR